MIQRQQTLWLILATVCAFLSFQFPFYTGTKIDNPAEKAFIDGASSLFLIVFTGGSLILSLVTIFFFKDRKLQITLCLVGIAVSFLILLFYYLEIKNSAARFLCLPCLSSPFRLGTLWPSAASGPIRN